jgi:Transmembrane family 220, helix
MDSLDSRVHHFSSLIMGFFFAYAAIVQLNDPDWLVWLLLHLSATCASFQDAFYSRHPYSSCNSTIIAMTTKNNGPKVVLILACIRGLTSYNIESEKYDAISSISSFFEAEVGREMGGCIVVASWMLFIIMKMRNTADKAEKSTPLYPTFVPFTIVLPVVIAALVLPGWLQSRNFPPEAHCEGTLRSLLQYFSVKL